MTSNIGTIRLRNLSDLQGKRDDDTDANTICISDVSKTPEKPKKTRKKRSATTAKKQTNGDLKTAKIIVSNTAVKRTVKKEPLPGQLRIDSFFKSSTKTYKLEAITSLEKSIRPSVRKGRKRLFDESTITTEANPATSDHLEKNKYVERISRTRAQLQAKVKENSFVSPNCPSVVIDLCSDDDSSHLDKQKGSKDVDLGVTEIHYVNASLIKTKNNQDLEHKVNCDVSFKENVVGPYPNLLNNSHVDNSLTEDIPQQKKRKACPPYKVVEGTTFVVDGFQFGDIPNATHYFLSHYHADHYIGLTRKFAHPLYMSPITARLVRTFIPIDNQYLHEIEEDKPIIINDIEITAIDANHCPGAIMLLFKFSTGKCILHTGDFRANFEMESLPIFWNEPRIDLIYLDTTYLSKNYDFCHQSESIYKACTLVRQFHEKNANKRILHVCGSYLIGKEKVWLTVANEFDLRVWTEPHRRKAVDCLNWPELTLRLTDDPHEANMHVISLGKISYPQLDQYFKQFEGQFDMLLGIRPSGWEKNSKPSYGKRISVIGVEYSEHSSYKELERFVRFLKPKNVISTVPVERDLSVTATVPKNWYMYKGYGGMVSKSYQPSISTFLATPQNKLPKLSKDACNMKLSPLKKPDS